jgi:DNA-binding response OmpR family regulator
MNKKRILIVDDEAGFTRMLKLNLEQTTHYEVRVENNATKALEAARQFEPNLILLDVMMPDIDGGELAARFRENPRWDKVPIVFLTAAAKKNEVSAHGGTIGGLQFLAKPIGLPELTACLNRHLAET